MYNELKIGWCCSKSSSLSGMTSEYVWFFQRLEACSCYTFTPIVYGWHNDFGGCCLDGLVTQAYLMKECFNRAKYKVKSLVVGICISAESGKMSCEEL